MKKLKPFYFIILSIFSISLLAQDFPPFDMGPDQNEPMERELVKLIQELPYLPGISTQLQVLTPKSKRGQKMRPDFGAMPVRGFLKKNSVKVLVIGQDGTHIAEGANRPGIAGFGGRVQDIMKHFGIYEGVLFTNLFVNTISGQYGSRNTPVYDSKNKKFINTNVIENRQWLLAHDGAYADWRNKFISWVIRNNLDSLKMVVLLGQAGKDAGANFVTSIGGIVNPNKYRIDIDAYEVGDGSHLHLPQFIMTRAGGNNEWAVPITKDGGDVAEILRKNPDVQEKLEEYYTAEIIRLEKKKRVIKERPISSEQQNRLIARLNSLILKIKLDIPGKLQAAKTKLKYDKPASQSLAIDLINAYPEEAKNLMVFSRGGKARNGVLYPQQFGGWDLFSMQVKNKFTRSIKGLKIPCHQSKVGPCSNANSIKAPNVIFVASPHPTYLTNVKRDKGIEAANQLVKTQLIDVVKNEEAKGWIPPQAENSFISNYKNDVPYVYDRGIIPPSHGDPGITALRLLPVSTAKRLSFKSDGSSGRGSAPRGIIIGTRKFPTFDKKKMAKMVKDLPSNKSLPQSNTVLTGRPQIEDMLFKYDRGPDFRERNSYASLLFDSNSSDLIQVTMVKDLDVVDIGDLDNDKDEEEIINLKDYATEYIKKSSSDRKYQIVYNKIFDVFGIDVFNSKTHMDAGFFGHYRGTFEKPEVVILADPVDWDSFITSKASTGDRGQFLHGLMRDLGIETNYLVLSTVPFGMEDATAKEWGAVLEITKKYRDQIIKKLLSDGQPKFIADGNYAKKELTRILGSVNKFVSISQRKNSPGFGIKAAGETIKTKFGLSGTITGKRIDIPREHLTWIARLWEGTSGSRVITATDKANKGKAFLIIAPDWARNEKPAFTKSTREFLSTNWIQLAEAGEPYPGESISAYVNRRYTQGCASKTEWKEDRSKTKCADTVPAIKFPTRSGR